MYRDSWSIEETSVVVVFWERRQDKGDQKMWNCEQKIDPEREGFLAKRENHWQVIQRRLLQAVRDEFLFGWKRGPGKYLWPPV